MKKVLLGFAFLIGSVASAAAACTSPAIMHDFPGTTFNMSLATAPDANCESNVALPTWAGGTLGAMANYGTSPGAVLVPGVNAFITNSPSITAAPNAFAAGSLANGAGVDGWSIPDGLTTDAAATAGGTGTHSAKLRLMTTQLNSLALNQSSQITQETATAGALGTTADTAWTSGVGTVVAILKNIAGGIASIVTNTGASIPAGTNIVGKVGIDQTTDGTTNAVRLTSRYPAGATPITASATGTTAATTATLAGAVAKTTYICSLSVRANATANTNVTDTVTGVISGTLSRALWVPANTAGLGVDEQIYDPCLPASATNTAIAVVSGAPGTGGIVTVNATGYQQ